MVCLPVFRKLGSKSTAAGVGCHWPVDVEVVTSLTCCPCWASDCQHTSTESSSAWPGFSLKYPAGPWPGPGIVPFPCLACRLLIPFSESGKTGLIICLSPDRKSTRLNSSHLVISYAVFCL